MKKGIFTGIVAAFTVMMFAASAYAVPNRVELKSSVPNIPKSLCYQAGAVSMEFGQGTVMQNGDVIQFTLNNGVVLCKDIEFFIALSNGAATTDIGIDISAAVYAGPLASSNALDPALDAAAAGTAPQYLDRHAASEVGFLVKGLAGNQIITMTLGSRATEELAEIPGDPAADPPVAAIPAILEGEFTTAVPFELTIGTVADTAVTVSLFDKKEVALLFAPDDFITIKKDDDDTRALKDYVLDIDPEDNVICIDTLTFDYQGERVEVTPDSISVTPATDLTFSTAREIAKILAQAEYELVTCKDAPVVGNIILGEGQSASCPPFDYDTGANYCPNTHKNNKIIIQALTNIFPVSSYKVTLEVKVNGLAGDQGVYIGQGFMEYASDDTLEDICAASLTSLSFETYAAPGTCGDTSDVVPGESGCTVDCENKVVRATTYASDLGITQGGNQDFLRLGLPAFRYDTGIVKEGDVVSVRVVVFQDPCGTIFDEEITIGTFGCAPETKATTLLYPYFTPANGSYFWSAYAITNLSDVPGTVTLYMYESDGDAFKGEVATPVPAHSIWATRVDDSIVNPDITWTQTAGTGSPGDAMLYIRAVTTFTADGFGFIAGSPTGESMGYLPRVNDCCN